MISLVLPIPVSVNAAYANAAKGRRRTPDAQAWFVKAQAFVLPFIKEHQKICDTNLLLRRKYYSPKRGLKLQALKADHPNVAYAVTYTFNFPDDAIRDVFNFEKLLTDFLVNCGFMLDDNFIVDGRVKWGKLNPKAPNVEIEIISLDRQAVLRYNLSTSQC